MNSSVPFYSRLAVFSFREELSGIANAIGRLALYPFFVWLLAIMWQKFARHSTHFSLAELFLYVGITEIIQMNTLRFDSLQRASSDFSLSLARPRSWLTMQAVALFGRTLGKMFIQSLFFVVVISLMVGSLVSTLETVGRFFALITVIAAFDALFSVMFASGKVIWENVTYFRLPVTKFFLVFGGVLAPISDFSEPFRSILLALPFSDVVFQPAYFAVKGEFFGLSATEWCLRLAVYCAVLALFNVWLFGNAKRKHQSYGG